MSERYVNYACVDCGTLISTQGADKHDAFHDRIDRLEEAMFRASELLVDGVPEPDPVCPFPMGAKVRRTDGVNAGVLTVTGWKQCALCDGRWEVCVEGNDAGFKPADLELVSEPERLVCAVCGEPVGVGRPFHLQEQVQGKGYHAATLTPPEPPLAVEADPGVTNAYNKAINNAADAVKALQWRVVLSGDPADCNYSCDDGPCTCSGVTRVYGWSIGPDDAVAAIEGLRRADD